VNRDNIMKFELSAPATDKLIPAVEVSIAGVLSDFGLGEETAPMVAGEVIRGILASMPNAPADADTEVRCVINLNGDFGTLELSCNPPCNLQKAADAVKRNQTISKCLLEAVAKESGTRLIITVRLSKPEP
jgi:hypothetical protein